MNFLKLISYNALTLLIIFGTAETATRLLFPEFSNAYFSDNVTHGNIIHRHHQWGHRVAEEDTTHNYKRSANEVRVLFIGDSVTFGYGVTYEDIYFNKVEDLSLPEGCTATISGVGRYGSNLDILLNTEFKTMIYQGFDADYIIYQFNVNDLDPVGTNKKTTSAELTLREKFEKFRLSYLNRSAFLKAVQSWTIKSFQQHQQIKLADSLRYSDKKNPSLYSKQWALFEQSLIDTKNTFASQGIKFAIMLMPEAIRISGHPVDNEFNIDTSGISKWPNEKVAAIAEKLDTPTIDPLPALQQYRQNHNDNRLYFPNDFNHPNTLGHEIIGKGISKGLSDLITECNL